MNASTLKRKDIICHEDLEVAFDMVEVFHQKEDHKINSVSV